MAEPEVRRCYCCPAYRIPGAWRPGTCHCRKLPICPRCGQCLEHCRCNPDLADRIHAEMRTLRDSAGNPADSRASTTIDGPGALSGVPTSPGFSRDSTASEIPASWIGGGRIERPIVILGTVENPVYHD